MKLPPLRSTLFPYTTLFRSAVEIALDKKPDLILLDIMLPRMDGLTVCKKIRTKYNMPILMLTAKDEEIDKDRKSTRLNSSHVAISYAVFCLKKINKI